MMRTWECPKCKTVYTELVTSCSCARVDTQIVPWPYPPYPYPYGWWGIYPPYETGGTITITSEQPFVPWLSVLYSSCANEDIAMAEEGIGEYATMLNAIDHE